MKVLVYLSQRSIELDQQNQQKKEKAEMAEEEDDGAIIEDEDDDGIDIESEEDDDDVWDGDSEADEINDQLYSSPLDDIHEILNLHEKLNALQTGQGDFFQFLMSQLD
jgi:hypothetical protein